MCGIIAVFNTKTLRYLDKILKAFNLLKKRGPDSGSIIFNSNECLGFRRLSINDTSINGDQPLQLDGIKLMCNGEIYNHRFLAEKYDLKTRSGSDCEVLVHLYKKIGFEKMVNSLDGVFAIVLTDGDKVFLARDRIGVRPLYIGWTDDGEGNRVMAVASIPNALIDFCTNIGQMPPGSFIFHNKVTKEMSINIHTPILLIKTDDPTTELRKRLCDAVEKRLMTDRPIGCLLSGGVDSSIITSILASRKGGENIRTYSIGMEGSTDLKYARLVAEFLKTKHTEIKFTEEEAWKILPQVIHDIGSYDVTTVRASVGMWLLGKYISENSDDVVIFSGEGSDELLMGYLYFHYAPSPAEAQAESERLISELNEYDVLRADRCISTHGLELRVPFLDRHVVDLCVSMNTVLKLPSHKIEKLLLRNAFSDKWLPNEVLWRQKEGMSDGTGNLERPLSKCFQERINNIFDNNLSLIEKEALYYRQLFDSFFGVFQPYIPRWMPKWTNSTDPSGRVLSVFGK